MKVAGFLFFVFVTGWCLWSCEKSSSYSEIPEIHFQKLVLETDGIDPLDNPLKTATVTFSFADGDGDIGTPIGYKDTSSICYTWYKKMPNGEYEKYIFPDTKITTVKKEIPFKDVMYRDEAQNKLLRGTIKAIFSTPLGSPAGMDTVRIEFYITDRAQHKSNVEYTPDFSFLDEYVEIEEQ